MIKRENKKGANIIMMICCFAKKGSPVIMGLLVGAAMVLYGIFGFSQQRQRVRRCTAETSGIVVSVEQLSHPYRDYGRSARHLLYRASIEPTNEDIFGSAQLFTDKTEYVYKKDEKVSIYYDPTDTSCYYIEHAKPSATGYTMISCGLILMAVGGVFCLIRSRKNSY